MLAGNRLVKPQSVSPISFVTERVVAKNLFALLEQLLGIVADDRIVRRLSLWCGRCLWLRPNRPSCSQKQASCQHGSRFVNAFHKLNLVFISALHRKREWEQSSGT